MDRQKQEESILNTLRFPSSIPDSTAKRTIDADTVSKRSTVCSTPVCDIVGSIHWGTPGRWEKRTELAATPSASRTCVCTVNQAEESVNQVSGRKLLNVNLPLTMMKLTSRGLGTAGACKIPCWVVSGRRIQSRRVIRSCRPVSGSRRLCDGDCQARKVYHTAVALENLIT